MPFQEATVRLQELIHRQDQVTTELHPARRISVPCDGGGRSRSRIRVGASGVVVPYTGM